MELSDELGSQSHEKLLLEEQVRGIFRDSLGLIRTALVAQHRLGERDARALENDLYVWFLRFCMRSSDRSPDEFRSLLLVACHQFAREYLRYIGVLRKKKGASRNASRSSSGEKQGRPSDGKGERVFFSEHEKGRVRLALSAQPGLFRELLCLFLNSEPGLELVGQGRDEHETGQILSEKGPAVLLFDCDALGTNGTEAAIARLRRTGPGTRILVLTNQSSAETAECVLRAGGSGVVEKQLGSGTLLRAIHAVAAGEVWANRLTVAQTLEHLAEPTRGSASDRELTKREWEVVDCVSRGLRNKEIARRLSISERTVKSHVNSIFRKLELDNRLAVGLYALRKP